MEAVPIDELLQHRRWLCALARGLVADPEVAREVEQETWLVALRHPPKDRRNLRGWLGRVAARQARNRWRRSALAGPLDTDVPTDHDPAEMAAQVEVARVLAGQVLALDEPYRTTVLLRFWHGLDSPAIARREGIAAGTVRWRLKVALDQLRASLAEQRGPKTWATFLAPLVRQPAPASFGSLVALLWLPLLLPTAAAVALVAAAVTLLAPTPNEPAPHRVAALTSAPEIIETPSIPDALAASTDPSTATATTQSTAQRTEVVPPATDSATGSVAVARGRLVSNDGQPIAGGQVRFSYEPNSTSANWTAWAEAGPEGHFEVPLPKAEPHQQNQGASGILGAEFRAPFRVARSSTVSVPASQIVEFGAVQLALGARVEGVVLTVDGLPLAGAHVTARAGGRDNLRHLRYRLEREPYAGRDYRPASETPRPVSTTSGVDGRYALDGVAAGATVVLASASCHAHRMTSSFRVSDGESAVAPSLVLDPAPPDTYLRAVVLDPDGNPVSGANLREVGMSFNLARLLYPLQTDEDGEFWQCGLPQELLVLEARHYLWAPSEPTQVRPGSEPVELRLRVRHPLRLRVTSNTGERLGDVKVTQVHGPNSRESRSAHAVPGEDWLEVRLPPEPKYLCISAPEHHELDLGVIDPREQHDVLDIVLERIASIRCTGRVVDADGNPVQGALVGLVHAKAVAGTSNGFPARSHATLSLSLMSQGWLSQDAASFAAGYADVAVADEHGTWSFTVEERDTYYLHVRAAGWSLGELGPLALTPEQPHDFGKIQLTRGGRLQGRVVDESGAPNAHVVVAISRGDGCPISTRTDADGFYSFENLTPGSWFVRTQQQEILFFGSVFERTKRPAPIEFNTAVAEGETTTFDLLPTSTERVAIELTLRVDGTPAVGWEASLDLDGQYDSLEGHLDENGNVGWSWTKDSSETAWLFVESPTGVRIGREVKLAELSGPFVLDIQTGELVLHGVPLEEDDVAPTGAYCKFDGWIAVALLISEDGTWRARVPAGDWRVARGDEDADAEDPDELPLLNSGTLVPGGVLELHLP